MGSPQRNPSPDGAVYAVASTGTSVLAGGFFTTIGGQARNYLAAVDPTTGLATSWNPNPSTSTFANVLALAVTGSSVYVGGTFTSIGGQSRNHLAAIDATTGTAMAWNPGVNGLVNSVVANGAVFAGGQFTGVGGVSRNNLAAIYATTGAVTSWNPGANATVNMVVAHGNTIYVGGDFSQVGGQSRPRLAAVDPLTGNVTSWNPVANSNVLALVVRAGKVYFSGLFGMVGGQPRNRLAGVDSATGALLPWNPSPNAGSQVSCVAADGQVVYVGGSFTTIGGQSRIGLAALDPVTGSATSWNPALAPSPGNVRCIVVNGALSTGGVHHDRRPVSFGSGSTRPGHRRADCMESERFRGLRDGGRWEQPLPRWAVHLAWWAAGSQPGSDRSDDRVGQGLDALHRCTRFRHCGQRVDALCRRLFQGHRWDGAPVLRGSGCRGVGAGRRPVRRTP